MDIKDIKNMNDEEFHEWGESAMYCGGLDAERYRIECYRRIKEFGVISKVFQSFNLSYGELEVELVKRFSKTFDKEIKESSLLLGRCFDNLNDDNIKRLAMYGIFNSNDIIWLNNLDTYGRYKFVIECLIVKLRKQKEL